MIIAIDGPAGAGKSTVARELARRFDFTYIDTGAMYRALTLKAFENNVPVSDAGRMEQLLTETSIELIPDNNILKIILDGRDVTEAIRQPQVSNNVSATASHEKVREIMVDKQRQLAGTNKGIVMDGRDIGTVVFPNAEVKIFLTASVEERASRRYKEQTLKGISTGMEELTEEIRKRDLLDMNRAASPLRPADDAIMLDTTELSFEEVIEKVKNIARKINPSVCV